MREADTYSVGMNSDVTGIDKMKFEKLWHFFRWIFGNISHFSFIYDRQMIDLGPNNETISVQTHTT